MDYGVNMDNVSKNFLRRATVQHHRICSKLNQIIGKPLFIEWPHENEVCIMLSIYKFHKAIIKYDKKKNNNSLLCCVDASVVLLRSTGSTIQRRLIWKESSTNLFQAELKTSYKKPILITIA